jgi:hypothetical protein
MIIQVAPDIARGDLLICPNIDLEPPRPPWT